MQDIQLINAGQLFPNTANNGGVSIDRRLRQTHLQNQALKCPRCDSSNTKFCYYNNYNLSQPRHFCKSCRRYWTKGGVLRNVPVGGGCRKSSKRSSSSSAAKSGTKSSDEVRSKPKSNTSNSSSESSSLTGSGNAAVVVGSTADLAAPPSASVATPPCTEAASTSFATVFGFADPKYIFPQIRNQNFSSEMLTAAECGGDEGSVAGVGGGGFTEIGNFSNLNNETTTHNFTTSTYDAVSPFQQYGRPYEQWQLSTEGGAEPGAGGGYIDQTVQIDHGSPNLGSEPLSWHQEQQQQNHQMFGIGLTSAIDQGYWSQQEWSNADNNNNAHPNDLYLP